MVSVNVTKYKEFPQLYVLQIFAELLTIMHIFYKFIIITLQYFHSDTMMIADDVQESDSTTVSGINVCGESMPASVCGGRKLRYQRKKLVYGLTRWRNKTVHSISGGRYSPVMSTLNTTWDDVSDRQQRYYIRKAKEAVAAALSVITPGQEESVWEALQSEVLGIQTETANVSTSGSIPTLVFMRF